MSAIAAVAAIPGPGAMGVWVLPVMGSGTRGDRGHPRARVREDPLKLDQVPQVHLRPGDDQEVAGKGKELLVAAEDLAQPALGAVSEDGLADSLGGGDEASAPDRGLLAARLEPDRVGLAV